MKNLGTWILLLTLALIGLYRMTRLFGMVDGLVLWIGLILLIGILFFGIDRYHRWRSNRLVQSILPGETVVASGLVSENISDETPAILVRGFGNLYRVHIADSRGSQTVLSVSRELTRHVNAKDLKEYMELSTDQGEVHFAPRKEFLVFGQSEYAQEVLNELLANGVAPKGLPRGA